MTSEQQDSADECSRLYFPLQPRYRGDESVTRLIGPVVIIAPQNMFTALISVPAPPETERLRDLLYDWRGDSINFLHHDAPKILLVVVGSFVLVRLLRAVTRGMIAVRARRAGPGPSAQQIKTLANVINSIGMFVILFVATLEILKSLGLDLGPLLASAGIVGLAIGFGAQTLVKDFINGFFVLLEDQYNLGDVVRLAGLKGTVEDMTLRRTVLRDDDGTVHIVPNSQIQTVSNMTRDWAQFALRVTVSYSEPSDKIIQLLRQVGEDIRHDPAFQDDMVSDPQVAGIDRVGNGEAEYLVLIKTRPNKQYGVSREFRRRIKESFDKNKIQPGPPGRIFVMDSTAESKP
jgi:moderate conductance mechanosensitive channel